jgi:hypothetical protein
VVEIKICNKCKLAKDITEFSKNQRQCKVCNKAYKDSHRKPNIIKTHKVCSKCGDKKSIDEFRKGRRVCKNCMRLYANQYRNDNKDEINRKAKIWRDDNKDKIQEYTKRYDITHKEYKANYNKKWRENNKDYFKEYQKDYNQAHKKERNNRNAARRLTDIAFRIRQYISNSINVKLNKEGTTKNGKGILEYLPYSINELKQHLESQFESWMSWNNHGVYMVDTWDDNDQSTWTWQIDHIISHSKFHYTTMDCDEFRECWSLSNLRPYPSKQNLLDGKR